MGILEGRCVRCREEKKTRAGVEAHSLGDCLNQSEKQMLLTFGQWGSQTTTVLASPHELLCRDTRPAWRGNKTSLVLIAATGDKGAARGIHCKQRKRRMVSVQHTPPSTTKTGTHMRALPLLCVKPSVRHANTRQWAERVGMFRASTAARERVKGVRGLGVQPGRE